MKPQPPAGGKPNLRMGAIAQGSMPPIVMTPIGVVRTPFAEKAQAPRQAVASAGARGHIELVAGAGFEDALDGIEAWSHLWIVFAFHLNTGWKPKVQPPRSDVKRGLFATRSPHRPNPIGLSVVRLEAVRALTLHVCELDMVDGTPVLDIKPYVPYADAIPAASSGWLEGDARPADPTPMYEVTYARRATEELLYLAQAHALALAPLLESALSLGPEPHAYRRIRPQSDGSSILAIKEWRARFRAEGRRIEVLSIHSGYGARDLDGDDPALDVHRAFVERFRSEA